MTAKRKKSSNKNLLLSVSLMIVIFGGIIYYTQYLKKSENFNGKSEYAIRGIDLSHHNPILDWTEVKNQNIHFAYIKATEGITHKDRNYPYNYDLAKKNNIKIGSYHFYNFAISGYEQAKHFIRTAQCESGDLIPAIDVEHSPDNPYSKDTVFYNSVIKELAILENELYEYYGVHPLIYTNTDCYKLYIEKHFPDNPIWISSPHKEPDKEIKNWVIWQFTHQGEFSGIAEKIDFNYFRHSYEHLKEISIP